jgi:hypothetical protein
LTATLNVINMTALPAMALFIIFAAMFTPQQRETSRKILIAAIWMQWILGAVLLIAQWMAICIPSRTMKTSEMSFNTASSLCMCVVFGYPSLLLTLLLRHMTRWLIHPNTIWWMAAVTCVAASLPATLESILHLAWREYSPFFSSIYFVSGPTLPSTLSGITVLARIGACFAAFQTIIWALCTGRKSRITMKICATLLFISALTELSHVSYVSAMNRLGSPVWTLSTFLIDFLMITPIYRFVNWTAFALAIHITLNLPTLSTHLDGTKPEPIPPLQT